MEIKASAKYLRISPRKLRMLTTGLRGMAVEQVLLKLGAYPQRGSELLRKVVLQAMANAKNNLKLSPEKLVIKTIEIGGGPMFERIDRSHGARFDRGIIKKRTAHIFLTLAAKEEKPVEKTDLPPMTKITKKAVNKKSLVGRKKPSSEGEGGKES